MFVEACMVRGRNRFKKPNGNFVCLCSETHILQVTLVFYVNEEIVKTSKVLICANIPLCYIFDIYFLYTNLKIEKLTLNEEEKQFASKETLFLKEGINISIFLPKYFDPRLWLYKPFENILFYNYKRDCGYESLELYIKSTQEIKKFYVVGEKTNILLSDFDSNTSFFIHATTIKMLLEQSLFCNRPFIFEA